MNFVTSLATGTLNLGFAKKSGAVHLNPAASIFHFLAEMIRHNAVQLVALQVNPSQILVKGQAPNFERYIS
jgi:hypothetical protein